MKQRLRLKSTLCPGDILTMTAAIYSLHHQYPGEYETDVRTSADAIWEHNPDITTLDDDTPDVLDVDMHYPAVNHSNQRPYPFIVAYTQYLAGVIDRPLICHTNRPRLYLDDQERSWIDQVRQYVSNNRKIPFWLVNAGIKDDYTAKLWPTEYYQEVIDRTRRRIQWVQVGAGDHWHPDLAGVIDLRAKTSHRELIRLCWHAAGGLGPITYLQHLCAAWEKPYICLAGGREPAMWIQYPLQTTLHTVGQLDCCQSQSCWKSRAAPLDDGSAKDHSLCEWPVYGFSKPVARCMAAITPREVADAIDRSQGRKW